MTTPPGPSEAFALATLIARFAAGGDRTDWEFGSRLLRELDGRTWLLVDHVSRHSTLAAMGPISGEKGWRPGDVAEPSGFVATVTSFHANGRVREQATRILAENRGSLRGAALSVRLLDHVPQVRDAAMAGLAEYLAPEQAKAALDVVLAGRDRWHGPAAVEALTAILSARNVFEPIVLAMLADEVRERRRWAYSVAHAERMLTPDVLLGAVRGEPDQWLRARCATWLAEVSRPEDLRAMLEARPVEARLIALTTIADADLPQDRLAALLVDRSPRVRDAARGRATQRGVDVADFYATRLATDAPTPAVIVRCLDGLTAVAAVTYAELTRPYLSHEHAAVRAAAADGFGQLAERRHVLDALTPLLLDPSAKVCAMAARMLTRVGAPVKDAEAAWNSSQPWSREAAWRLCRGRGNWDRVEADLRACVDADVALRGKGRAGIGNWLAYGAARTWGTMTDEQRERIADLLDRSGMRGRSRDVVAFTAGIASRERFVQDDPEPIVEAEPVTTHSFTPAMGRFAPTRFYDPVVALTRERLWRALAVTYVAPRPGDVIVDVGCGTGSLALLLNRVEPRAEIIGVDPDPDVLAVARRKAAGSAAVQWRIGMGDALVDSVGADAVDTVVSSLVLHQCPVAMKRAVLASMFAVLRPGGRLVIADFGRQRTRLMRLAFRIVQFADGKEDTQPSADGIVPELMSEAGFRHVREAEVVPTVTGSISVYVARKP